MTPRPTPERLAALLDWYPMSGEPRAEEGRELCAEIIALRGENEMLRQGNLSTAKLADETYQALRAELAEERDMRQRAEDTASEVGARNVQLLEELAAIKAQLAETIAARDALNAQAEKLKAALREIPCEDADCYIHACAVANAAIKETGG